ncbi:MAG: hypothetical protein U0X20_20200 [Caldilineaceae bacterium]
MLSLLLMDGINWGHVLDGFLSDGMNWGMAYALVLGLFAIMLIATILVWQLLGASRKSHGQDEQPTGSLQFK